MNIFTLFLEFLKIGAFAFGGAYGAIPLIREAVLSRGWMDETQLMNLLGISESTPGPIMVNAATMTGFGQAGILGAAVATLGVILTSFLIMLIVPRLQKKWSGHRVIRLTMRGIKPCLLLLGVLCLVSFLEEIQKRTGIADYFDCDCSNSGRDCFLIDQTERMPEPAAAS